MNNASGFVFCFLPSKQSYNISVVMCIVFSVPFCGEDHTLLPLPALAHYSLTLLEFNTNGIRAGVMVCMGLVHLADWFWDSSILLHVSLVCSFSRLASFFPLQVPRKKAVMRIWVNVSLWTYFFLFLCITWYPNLRETTHCCRSGWSSLHSHQQHMRLPPVPWSQLLRQFLF